MAGGERAVQRETVKTLYQSHWLVSTPRLSRLLRDTAVESQISEYNPMKTQVIEPEAPQGLARRSFLAGLAITVPIVATTATPALAWSETQSEIDTMIALRDRWRELDIQTSAFEDRFERLKADYLAIADTPPSGLIIRLADFRLLREFGSAKRWQGLTHFTASDIQAMRRRPAMRYSERFVAAGMSWKEMGAASEVDPVGTLGIDYDIFRTRVPWPLAQRRKDSIVAAFDRWQADNVALRASMGVDDAEEALEEHICKLDDAVKAIVQSPATTAQALQFKAGLMAEWADEFDPFEDWRKLELFMALLEDIAKLRPATLDGGAAERVLTMVEA